MKIKLVSKRALFGGATILCLLLQGFPAVSDPVEAWVQRYGDMNGSADYAQKVVADNEGNVIVAGYKSTGINDDDWLTIKYSNLGVPLWTNYYDGPGHWTDQASAVAVDTNGNVFVTGFSYNAVIFTSADYTTIAYSSAGVPMWTNRYDGPTNSQDKATAIAVGENGNVFVTGYSANLRPSALFGASWSYDYVTVAYSGAGLPLWTNRYNGPGNNNDQAAAIATDSLGNVIVTGQSIGVTTRSDYATIAYSEAGVPLWTNRYNGPPGDGSDYATAIAVGTSGTVFVTGYSYGGLGGSPYEDYATVAYSNAGSPLWTNRYNGSGNGDDRASAIAVDNMGNVFVTGSSVGSGGFNDYATIAYTATGVPLWTNTYGGLADSINEAAAIAVDSSGNVYVTGSSRANSNFKDYATVAYSSTGSLLWVNRYETPAQSADFARSIAVAPNGKIFVSGISYTGNPSASDVVTIAYSENGIPLWTNRYNGLAYSADAPNAGAVDSFGNVFVTGAAAGGYATIAYGSTGVPLWTNLYGGKDTISQGGAHSLAIDGNGNVFVTGLSDCTNYADYLTIKYSNSGIPMWTNRYNGIGNGNDDATDIAVNGAGEVYVTGYSYENQTDNYVTIKYSNSGATLWTRKFNGASTSRAIALALDDNGNVFVTGDVWFGSRYSGATIAYSSAGVPLWTNRIDLGANGRTVGLAVGGTGNVFVTGYSDNPNSSYDYCTVAYSNSGLPLWTNRFGGPGNHYDQAAAIAVGMNNGNVYVTGFSWTSSSTTYDYATIAYSSLGVPLWTNRYNGPISSEDKATAIRVDSSGNIIVAGYSASQPPYSVYLDGPFFLYDYATVSYSSAGVPLWTNRYNGPANGSDSPWSKNCLFLGPEGSIYVTGNSSGDFATVKYVSTSPSITLQPTSVTFGCSGFTLSITASGTGPLTYQWRLNGVDIAGANASTFTLPSGSVSDAGNYDVVVSSPYGSVTSSVITATFFGDLKFYAGTTLAGGVGSTYRVDFADVIGGATNDWQTLTTITLPYSPYLVIDPYSPTQAIRFYRVVPQ